MGSPSLKENEVVSYRCDGKASRLWTMRLLGPAVFPDLGGLAVSACGANAFLLVVGVTSAPSASNVGGLLSTTHGWRTFGHSLTRTSCPPTSPL